MKRILLLVALALTLPLAAFAGSIDFSNSGGTLSGSSSGLTLAGSTLISIDGLNGGGLITGTNLGSLAFTTGALISGSLQMGGTFGSGGTITITGNGSNGVPNGVIFTGTFSNATWTLVTLANGTHNYVLTGVVTGTLGSSSYSANGVTVQLTINTGKGFFNGSTRISSGDTAVTVPEPGSLALLATGIAGVVGLAALLRRKINLG